MHSLVAAQLFQRPMPPRLPSPAAEDRYYRSNAPRGRRLFPLAPLAAIVGIVVLILNVAAR